LYQQRSSAYEVLRTQYEAKLKRTASEAVTGEWVAEARGRPEK
jgi:hypothetical protein